MKIIISPAKKMNQDEYTLDYIGTPVFLKEAENIMHCLQRLSYEEAKTLWGCNDKIAELNFHRIQDMNLHHRLTPAILSYEGIQYQYMAPSVFERDCLCYVQEHLRILSGFYGVLKPMDGVTPYRLEMQAKVQIDGKKNLYDYWGDRIYQQVAGDDHIMINLASKEYSKCVESYLTSQDIYITCIFGEMSGNKVVQKGTYAKMARGEMVRFLAEFHITEPEKIKKFDRLGYRFYDELSTETEFIFLRNDRV